MIAWVLITLIYINGPGAWQRYLSDVTFTGPTAEADCGAELSSRAAGNIAATYRKTMLCIKEMPDDAGRLDLRPGRTELRGGLGSHSAGTP